MQQKKERGSEWMHVLLSQLCLRTCVGKKMEQIVAELEELY